MTTRRPALFRMHPDPTHDYTESHQGRGADYDDGFVAHPVLARMWRQEQDAIAALLGDVAPAPARVLDLACGTGRVTGVLATLLPGARITGVDVAESMLQQAREHVPGVEFVSADVRGLAAIAPDGSIDLLTAFRFLPNADSDLRASATTAMIAAVRPGGHLLLNNHRNFWSPSYVLQRARNRSGAPGALNRDILGPFGDAGFEVVGRRSLGLLPHSDERTHLVPEAAAERLESFNARRLGARHSRGSNTIWLLRKPG